MTLGTGRVLGTNTASGEADRRAPLVLDCCRFDVTEIPVQTRDAAFGPIPKGWQPVGSGTTAC